ncbi:MAG: CoA-binding protein [Planctomycetes bacterium]|nr:CoA-binding protein [Planctomycetota bacterium]
MNEDIKVAVIGASPNSDRYSYKALEMLAEYSYDAIPVSPHYDEVLGKECLDSLNDAKELLHTVSVYLRPDLQSELIDEIIAKNPKRVIFNPGTENPKVYSRLIEEGIEPVEACTLVMLRTGQF